MSFTIKTAKDFSERGNGRLRGKLKGTLAGVGGEGGRGGDGQPSQDSSKFPWPFEWQKGWSLQVRR